MLWSGFILGLIGSLHCIGMCGPIAIMLPVDQTNKVNKLVQTTSYHLGRLITYTLMGLCFGFLGKSIFLFGYQQQLSIIIGTLMVLLVVVPSKFFNAYYFSKPIYHIIAKIKSSLGQALKKKSANSFFVIGFLNGFLPCGLVYMAAFASISTHHFIEGGLYMFLFGLGTIPLMTATIYLGRFLNQTYKQRIQNVIPVFIIIIGLLFILRGFGLGIPYLSPPAPSAEINQIKCH